MDESLNKIPLKNTQKQLRENELLEKGVNEDASAFQMERLLEAIVRRCPTKPRWIKGGLGALDRGTNQKAKNWVYLIQLDIVENFQCRGLKSYDPRFFEEAEALKKIDLTRTRDAAFRDYETGGNLAFWFCSTEFRSLV